MDPTDPACDPIRRILENETKLNGTLYPTAEFRTLYEVTKYVRKDNDPLEYKDAALLLRVLEDHHVTFHSSMTMLKIKRFFVVDHNESTIESIR